MKNLKLNLLMLVALTFSLSVHAQWLSDLSGNKKSAELSNKAIDCMANLEYGRAQGFALSALSVDSRATSAKIVLAWTSGGDISTELMKSAGSMKMTDTEQLWYDIIQKPGKEHAAAAKASGNTEPLITYIAAYESYEALESWAKANVAISGPALNSLAYADFMGAGPRNITPPDGMNETRAEERFRSYISLTNSPNADDSYAEFLASQGDYEGAFESQMAAYQKVNLVSPYTRNLIIYWRKNNQDQIKEAVTKRVEAFYNDLERLDSRVDDMLAKDVSITEGMSSLQPWIIDDYDMAKKRYAAQGESMNWMDREAYDIDVHLSPNCDVAVVTFYMRGKYKAKGSDGAVDYHTRASEVWVLQNDDWFMMHSNFAPYDGGTGVPMVER
jgi:hypothetical protein